MADTTEVKMDDYQSPPSSCSPEWVNKDVDSDLTSFIDALWEKQVSDNPFDFPAAEQHQGSGSLGSLGDLHIFHDDNNAQRADHDFQNARREFQYPSAECNKLPSFDVGCSTAAGTESQNGWESTAQLQSSYQNLNHISSPYYSFQQPSLPVVPNNALPYDTFDASIATSRDSSCRGIDNADVSEPCYARLLHTCLRDTPEHTLTLKEIYAWIRSHTQKARDPKNKGWQNSVRHNLSMNAAFERVASSRGNGENKKGSLWRLTPQAMRDGVISTTRYRRDPKRKAIRRGAPAPQRQLSGAKGGAATRAASHARRQAESHERLMRAAHSRAQQRFFTSAPAPAYSLPLMPTYQHPPASPYFVSSNGTSPMLMQQAFSSPHTPATMQLAYDEQQKGLLQDLKLQHHLDYSQGLFGSMNDMRDYTPSLQTESSCFTDESLNAHSGGPMLL